MSTTTERTSRRRWVLLAVAVLVLAGGAWGAWRWTHATVLTGGTGYFVAGPLPVARAELHTGLDSIDGGSAHETITVTSARVHFSRNTAGATGSLSVCVRRTRSDDTGFGVGPEIRRDLCRAVRPVTGGARMLLDGQRGDYLVLTVSPRHAGVATVSGIDVSYRRGSAHLFQRGTQHFGGSVLTVNAT